MFIRRHYWEKWNRFVSFIFPESQENYHQGQQSIGNIIRT